VPSALTICGDSKHIGAAIITRTITLRAAQKRQRGVLGADASASANGSLAVRAWKWQK